MPGGGDPVGGGVRAKDDSRGTLLSGAIEGTGTVQRVRGGYGGGIFGGEQDNTAWASGRGETEMENFRHGGKSVDVSHGIPGQGRPAELPVRGMPRTSGDVDGDEGPFYALAFTSHRGYFGGGKPPPPKVHLMQHAVTLAYTELKAPFHNTARSGAKEAAVIGGGVEGEHGEGL